MKAKARKKAIRDDLTYMSPEEGLAMALWNTYYECADMSNKSGTPIVVALWKAEKGKERDRWVRVANEAMAVMEREGKV